MLRVLKQRTHFDLQPGYCSSSVEDRSDASHPYPFYPLPETVMSLESQEANNQNNTGHAVAPVYQNFAHPNFYFPPTVAVQAAKPSGEQLPSSNQPLPPPSPRQQQQQQPQQQPERLRQTEQAIYEKILKEATKGSGEKSNETAANGSEESFESANQEPRPSEPMTNHSQGDERVATAQEAATAEEDTSNPTQLRGESAAESAAADESSSRQMSPPSAQPMMSSPPPLMEVREEPEDLGDKSSSEECQDNANRRQSEDRSSEQFDAPQRSLSFEDRPLQIDEDSSSGRDNEMRSSSIGIKTEPLERQHSSPVEGVPNTVFPEPVSPVTRTPGASPPIKQEQLSPSMARGPVSPALTRGTVSPALSSQDPVSPVVARGPPPLLLASHIDDDDNVVYPPGSMSSTPSKNQDGGLGSRPDLDASNSSFNSACGSLTPGGPGSDGEKQGDLYYCHLCTYVGMSKHHFQVHMNSHFEHSCPHCDYSSRTEGRLKRHIKDFHSEEPPDTFAGNKTLRGEVQQPGRPKIFRCRQCDFSAENKIEFWEHSRSHIKSDKILQCPKCPFVTEYKHHLEYHLRNHFGSKPFKCGKCNYACVNKSMLNSHMKSHTNVYQYRCADCTYATKYCHSLKLHLKKYNHQPATVLNTDGSLPTDGSGDFELVSKRGPPRGPRGPRKEGLAPSPGMASPMLLPQTGLTGHSPLNGALFGPGFWPMNGLQPPPPLIPVSGMTPLSIHMPQDLGNKMAVAEKDAQMQQPGANNNHKSAGTDLSSSNQGTNPIKCNLCPFLADSYQSFSQHMLKVHAAAENQDLLNMFGIPPETLAERYSAKSGAAEVETSVPSSVYQHTPPKVQDMTQTWAALHHLSNSAASIAAGSMKATASADTYQSLGKEPFGSSNKISSPQMAAQEALRHRQRKESPLDLTKRRGGDLYQEYSGQGHRGGIIDYSPNGKRRYEAEREMSENGEERNTPPFGATSPAPPRKRSRKGKAYKLDTLCMKLQERYTGSPPPGYDESNEDEYSDYSMEKDSDAVPGEESGPSSAEPHHSGQDSAMDSSEKEDAAPVDYRELHSSLSVLNNGVSSSVDQRYISQEMSSSDERKVARRIEFGQERSPSGHRNGRLSDERSDGSPLTTDDPAGKGPRGNGSSYECHHCGIAFRDCIMYTMHMGYHGYQDPFKCNMCGQQSSNKVEFFLHIARTAHE